MEHWKHLDSPQFGFLNALSDHLSEMDGGGSDLFPDLRSASVVLVGSDYSGQHGSAKYESLSFLFADFQRRGKWEAQRQAIRNHYLPDRRRFSYERLGDRVLARALIPFLKAADNIPGLLVTVVVDRNVQCLLAQQRLRTDAPHLRRFSKWSVPTFEKLSRVVHLVSFFLAGLSAPNQDVLWFSDEDDVVANPQRLDDFVGFLGDVLQQYVPHRLGRVQIGTTKSDDGTRDIEDFVAIPDLAAGAVSAVLGACRTDAVIPSNELIVPIPSNLPSKAEQIVDWLSDSTQALRRLVLMIESAGANEGRVVKHLVFHRS